MSLPSMSTVAKLSCVLEGESGRFFAAAGRPHWSHASDGSGVGAGTGRNRPNNVNLAALLCEIVMGVNELSRERHHVH